MKRLLLLLLTPLFIITFVLWVIQYFWLLIANPERAWTLAVSGDQLANTVFNGNPDETISSRSARHCIGDPKDVEKWACLLCKLLDKIDKDHCKNNLGV